MSEWEAPGSTSLSGSHSLMAPPRFICRSWKKLSKTWGDISLHSRRPWFKARGFLITCGFQFWLCQQLIHHINTRHLWCFVTWAAILHDPGQVTPLPSVSHMLYKSITKMSHSIVSPAHPLSDSRENCAHFFFFCKIQEDPDMEQVPRVLQYNRRDKTHAQRAVIPKRKFLSVMKEK